METAVIKVLETLACIATIVAAAIEIKREIEKHDEQHKPPHD